MRQQSIGLLVPPRSSLFELATPVGVWASGRADRDADSPFRVSVGSPSPDRPITSSAGIMLSGFADLEAASLADLVVVPTWPVGADLTVSEAADCQAIVTELERAHRRGSVVVGLCLGAFAVAEAGLVDGREAVTHWAHREYFSSRFPAVTYVNDALYVDLGDVVTSAGSAAALDCCLHLVRENHGAEVATRLARSLVTPPHRTGNQTQFVPPGDGSESTGPLARILDEAILDLESVRTVADLGRLSGRSRRSLERLFSSELAVSPADWLAAQRVNQARLLLEGTKLSIEEVATRVGFGSAATLRRHFRRRLSVTPTAYRSQFGAERIGG